MRTTVEFKATGGQLFKELFVGMLLTSITFGIYYPWFLVSLQKLIARSTTLHAGDEELRVEYTATGGALFKQLFLGYLFTMWTFGIYLPWFFVRMIRFQQQHTIAVGADRTYRFNTELTGEKLFGAIIGPSLLSFVTFGVYLPWLWVTAVRTIVEASELYADDQPIGRTRFTLTGGALFGQFIGGYLLTLVTMGIYGFWFQVQMWRLFANALEIRIGDRPVRGEFTGTGGELFKISFVGYLLTMITFGVYGFWLIAHLLRFQLSNLRFVPAEELIDGASFARIEPALRAQPPELPVRAAAVQGDRRAAWARAFLPPLEAAEPIEWSATIDQNQFATEIWTDRVVPGEIGGPN
jgi:uncharacterized membrane protein YjgN (DUF898 family)